MARLLVPAFLIIGLAAAVPFVLEFGVGAPRSANAAPVASSVSEIVARGRIEPPGGVVVVSGPPQSMSTVAIADRLLVQQGSKVEIGQTLAVLFGHDVAEADLDVSLANLQLAQANKDQIEAGIGKPAETAAQENVLTARRAQLVRAQKELDRASILVEKKSTTQQYMDIQKAAFDQATQDVQQSENTIKALTEVRPVDDQVAAEHVAVAKANVRRARTALEQLEIRSRTTGTVLSIQTRAGEAVGSDGILRLADLDHLIVVAEVDESQIKGVKLGITAQIKGAALGAPISGTVAKIGSETRREGRSSSDVLVGRDARVVEVEIVPSVDLPKVVGAEVMVRFATPAKGS